MGDVAVRKGGRLPGFVYILLLCYFGAGLLLVLLQLLTLRRWRRRISQRHVPAARAQFAIWAALVVAGVTLVITWSLAIGLILVLCAQFLPRRRKAVMEETGD